MIEKQSPNFGQTFSKFSKGHSTHLELFYQNFKKGFLKVLISNVNLKKYEKYPIHRGTMWDQKYRVK